MKLSIITINLNNLSGLKKTVQSVLAQTFRDFEYIVIDGASGDGSDKYLSEVSEAITYWISEKDQGIYQAMNKGIERACGDYLLFLNSGDQLAEQDILEKIQDELNGTDIVYGNLILQMKDGHQTLRAYRDVPDNYYVYRESLPHPASFIKRDLFQLIGLYNTNDTYTSDWQFFMKALFQFNCSFKHLNMGITLYDLNGASSNPDNIDRMNQEKYTFLCKNPQVIQTDFFRSIDDESQMLTWLGKSKSIHGLFSLGFLNYFEKFLRNRS